MVELGDHRVLSVSRLQMRGRGSGIEVNASGASILDDPGRQGRGGNALPIEGTGPRSRRAIGIAALDEKRLFWRKTGEQRPSDEAGTALAPASARSRLSSPHDNGSFAALDDFAPVASPRPRLV